MTERKRVEAALTQAQTELERQVQESAERSRGEQVLRISEKRWRSLGEGAPRSTVAPSLASAARIGLLPSTAVRSISRARKAVDGIATIVQGNAIDDV